VLVILRVSFSILLIYDIQELSYDFKFLLIWNCTSDYNLLGAKFAFSIYDFEGNDQVDAFDLGSALRALGLVPTQKIVEKLGGQKKKGKVLS
jgi:hypothetical protein